jgi:hypothetical protein
MLYIAFRTLTTKLVRLVLDLTNNDMITVRGRGRSRRPSEGSRRSRVWTSPTPTSALKARGSRTFPELGPYSAAHRSFPRHHQHGHGEPRGRPSPLLQAFSSSPGGSPPQHEASSSGTTTSSSRPLSLLAPLCWRSATSLCTSGCPAIPSSCHLSGRSQVSRRAPKTGLSS